MQRKEDNKSFTTLSVSKAHNAQSIQQGEQWAIVYGKAFSIIVKGVLIVLWTHPASLMVRR